MLQYWRPDASHTSHEPCLLLAVAPTATDSSLTRRLADSLLGEARSGASFEELAKTFSTDNTTRIQGGELGWFASDKLPPEFAAAIIGWTTVGEYKGPVESRFGIHILKLLDYQPSKNYTLEEDFDRIKELARQDKTGKIVDKWIVELREETYVEYRMDDE